MAAAAENGGGEILTGPEVIAGSTRLSAGTAQKIVLNTLSSCVMIGLGKTFGPYMVECAGDQRGNCGRGQIKMVAALTNGAPLLAEGALSASGWEVKTAGGDVAGGCGGG